MPRKKSHPPWSAMIVEALLHRGIPLMRGDIRRYISNKYKGRLPNTKQITKRLSIGFTKGIEKGLIKFTNTRYTLNMDTINANKLKKSKRERQLEARRPQSLKLIQTICTPTAISNSNNTNNSTGKSNNQPSPTSSLISDKLSDDDIVMTGCNDANINTSPPKTCAPTKSKQKRKKKFS